MGADYSFDIKTIETHVGTILPLNISAIGTVFCHSLLNLAQTSQKGFECIKAKE